MKVIHIISGGDSGGAKTHLIALAKELVKHIDMKIVCFIEGDFYITAKEMGLPVVLLKQEKRTDVFFSDKLSKFIEEEKPDIVHAHGARANFSVYINRKKIKCPVITTVHSDYKLDFKDNLYKYIVFTMLNKLSLGKFDYYIGVSPEFKKMLVSRGYKEDKIYSVYNGIDFDETINMISRDEFASKYKLDAYKEKKMIGNVSRLEVVKAVDVFIKAAKKVVDDGYDVHFLIAGDGTQRENLNALIDELDLNDNVTLLGFINDVPSMLNFIDINVISSHSESFTYSLLEGARQKKASIASRVGGLPELIKDGETGLLFDDNDIDKLSENIKKLIVDDELRNKYGEELYNYAKKNFSTVSMGKRHLDIYNEVVKRGRK